MARRASAESTSDLYIRLGLSLDELQSGFVDAQRTVRDNMTRLQRENTIIDLQMKVNLTGLDSVNDAERILEIRTQALNQQLKNQRDRVRLATAELRNMTERTGANSDQTQRATLALERERLALADLEDQLRSLRDEQDATNDSSNSLLDRISEFIETHAPVVAAVLAIAGSFDQVTSSIKDLVAEYQELQKQSYELDLDIDDAEEFLRHMELAGGDIGDFEGLIRGISDAFVKGEIDDPEFVALISRYNAELTDANGRLKNFQELTEEVYKAWEKADAEGNGIEFLQMIGGESGVRDAIQYFRRYKEALDDTEKIFDAGLNFDELHQLDRELKLLTEQTSEFGEALLNLIIPAVRFVVENFFEIIKAGTEIVADCTEEVRLLGFRIAELGSVVTKPLRTFEGLDLGTEEANKELEELEQRYDELIQTSPWQQSRDFFYEKVFGDLDRAAKLRKAEYEFQMGATAHFDPNATPEVTIDEFLRDLEEEVRLQEEIGETAKETGDILSQYASKRITQYREDLENLRIELDNSGNDYLRKIAEAEKWFERETTKKLYLSTDERLAIEELYSAKLEQIEKDRADKEEEFQKAIDAIKQNALEKALAKIDKEKEAWTQKGIDEVKATEWAEQAKAEAIKKESQKLGTKKNEFEEKLRKYYENLDKQDSEYAKKLQAQQDQYRKAVEHRKQQAESLYSKLAALRHDDLTTALAAIEKEKQAWIQKGISEVSATEWAEQAKANAQRNAAMSVLKSQLQELRLFQKEGYTGLQKYYMQQFLKETGLKNDELQTLTPEIIKAFKQASDMAQRTLLPRFMTDWERNVNNKIRTYGSADLRNLERYDSKIGYLLPKYPAPPNPPTPPDKPTAPEGLYDDLQKLQEIVQSMGLPVEKINEQLEQINMPVDKLNEQLSHLNVSTTEKTDDAVKDSAKSITSSFEALTELIQQNLTPCLDGFAKQLANATEVSAALQNDMNNLHGSIGELVAYLESLARRAGQGGGGGGGNSVGPTSAPGDQGATNNITNTININEAHAWDSEHIQDLAEKVASVITPQITNAIGGDDNAY